MTKLAGLVPDENDLLALHPEELGGIILQILNSLGSNETRYLNRIAFIDGELTQDYPKIRWPLIQRALMEAWVWLEGEGLIAPDPSQSRGHWIFITRRGQSLDSPEKFESYRSASSLKKELLHPLIAEKVWSSYLRGDFDVAIFIAFKEVEIRVRELSQQGAEVIGTDLMRKAFGSPSGPLVPSDLPKGEQDSLAHLFAGAIGWFKNPQSHRKVGLAQVNYAVQALMFASHLIYLADQIHSDRQKSLEDHICSSPT